MIIGSVFHLKILVETSARHVHISKEHLAILFGADAELTVKKELSKPGQFACNERVSILGPTRPETQVELSRTDTRKVGIDAPIRESGQLEGTPGCKLIGPKGEVELTKGVIVAKRHAHIPPDVAEQWGIKDQQIVSLKVGDNERSLIFGDVVARVSASAGLAVHIDTDEANAAGLNGAVEGEIIL